MLKRKKCFALIMFLLFFILNNSAYATNGTYKIPESINQNGINQSDNEQEWQKQINELKMQVDHLENKLRHYENKYASVGLVLFLFGSFCALWAQNTGRNAISWFFAGLVFNVITVLVLLRINYDDKHPPKGVL